jgi:hypothetical protein
MDISKNGNRNSFTNVAGQTYKVRPVNDTLVTQSLAKIERAYRERGEPLDPPTYTVQIHLPDGSIGGEETLAFDEKALEVPGDELQTAKNKSDWAAHKNALARLEAEQNTKRSYLWLMGGVICETEATAEGWAREQQSIYGIDIPADPMERRWHYLTTVACPTAEDLARAIGAVTGISLSGLVASEEVDAMVETFRYQIQRAAPGGIAHPASTVEPQPEVAGDRHRQELGADPQPVSSAAA